MDPIIHIERIRDLTDKDYLSCSRLNKGPKGVMRCYLKSFREDDLHGEFTGQHAMMLKDENGNILSWSLIFWDKYDGVWVSHYYTRVSARRKGYGATVVKEVRRMFGETVVHPNSESGIAFYQSLSDQVIIEPST